MNPEAQTVTKQLLLRAVSCGEKLAERVSTDPHFENLPELVDHPRTSGILISTRYDLGCTNSNLRHYLGQIGDELGRLLVDGQSWFFLKRVEYVPVCCYVAGTFQ